MELNDAAPKTLTIRTPETMVTEGKTTNTKETTIDQITLAISEKVAPTMSGKQNSKYSTAAPKCNIQADKFNLEIVLKKVEI